MASRPSPLLPSRQRGWVLASAWLGLLPLLLQLPVTLASVLALAALLTGLASWKHNLPMLIRLLLVLTMLAAVISQAGTRFGRDTGCALLAAMLAIKASELRTLRDARSLLGFALFAPFAAFLLDQGPTTMMLSLLAVLAALLGMQQLADQEGHTQRDTGTQLRAIARLSAIGLPLALTAFWLFPRLGSPLWGIPERAMTRPGLSNTMTPGEWVDLMADDSPALRVQFFGAIPAPAQRYWRGPVLWEFDGRRWSAIPWLPDSGMPAAAAASPRWDYQIDYEPTDRRQLVALDLLLQTPPGAQLSPSDHVLRSQQALTGLTRWRMQSAPLRLAPDQLPPLLRRMALQLPPGYNPRTLALGQQWRQLAADDDNAIVQRALQWISSEFSYTLDTPLAGQHGVDEFLFEHKAGFCEHFSSAFVVLMRAAGIPARVVTGYAGGVHNRLGNYWVIRNMDAHAWAEVWLAQRGWVRIDPTAVVAPERVLDTLEDRLGQTANDSAAANARQWNMRELSDWMRRGWNEVVLSFDARRQQQLLRPLGIPQLAAWQLIVLFSIFAIATIAGMFWLLARGEREHDPLLRAWHRMERGYRRHGLAREPHEPALAWATRVQHSRPDPALLSLSQRFANARYAASQAGRTHAKLIRDLLRHRPRLGAS